MSFGLVISEARRARGWSQRDLAFRVRKEDGQAISPQYLNDLERDRRNPPGDHLLREFARELDLPLEYLHFVAGQLPEELRDVQAQPDEVQAAFQAFRKSLKETRR